MGSSKIKGSTLSIVMLVTDEIIKCDCFCINGRNVPLKLASSFECPTRASVNFTLPPTSLVCGIVIGTLAKPRKKYGTLKYYYVS